MTTYNPDLDTPPLVIKHDGLKSARVDGVSFNHTRVSVNAVQFVVEGNDRHRTTVQLSYRLQNGSFVWCNSAITDGDGPIQSVVVEAAAQSLANITNRNVIA